jgi:outer membrane protein TolC
MDYCKKITFLVILISLNIYAQDKMSKEEAIKMALEFNYGVKMAKKNVQIAKNNASFLNSGFLPSIALEANANKSIENGEQTLLDGRVISQEAAERTSYGGSIGVNYVLFDGLGRLYNFKKLKENYRLSELEARIVIENMVLQLVTQYYQVAEITAQTSILSETLAISEKRFKRLQLGYDFGQNTKLEVLNAEVDYSSDVLELKKLQTSFLNAKRNLNLSLGKPINAPVELDAIVNFESMFDLAALRKQALTQNASIAKANKNITISKLDMNIVRKNFLPTISINASYSTNTSIDESSIFFDNIISQGPRAGVTLNWNLFDGGSSIINSRNAVITRDRLSIQKEEVLKEVERSIENAYETYQNSLDIIALEQKNLKTNQLNFQRSESAFKLGQSTSIQYREAQLNLMNAKLNLNKAKYAAKIAELEVLKLAGYLLDTNF